MDAHFFLCLINSPYAFGTLFHSREDFPVAMRVTSKVKESWHKNQDMNGGRDHASDNRSNNLFMSSAGSERFFLC